MRIAIWNTAFLGDAVLTLPLIRVIQKGFPDAEIDFYVREGLESLFSAHPDIKNVYPVRKRGKNRFSALFKQINEIAGRHYDLWIDAHLSLRSSLAAFASRAPVRIGYAEAALSGLCFTKRTKRCFDKYDEIERLLRLAYCTDIPKSIVNDERWRVPELVLPKAALSDAESLLAPLQGAPIVALHPGSVWPTKRWTSEGFAHVLARAVQNGAHAVLLAGRGEEETAAEVLELSGIADDDARFLDLSGKTSLLTLAAVLAKVSAYVTNDSGPMHLAWAQGTPVTAIFGPTVRALGFFPRGKNSTVIESDEPCRPCGLHGHKSCPKGHFRCMKNIDPETVWLDVQKKLSKDDHVQA